MWSHQQESLCVGVDDNTVRVVDTRTGKVGEILRGFTLDGLRAAWSKSGRFIAIAGSNGAITVRDMRESERDVELTGNFNTVTGC